MSKPTYPLYLQDAVCENVLLFDGLSRAGKGLTGPLVSQLPRLDFAQLVHAADYIPTLWHMGLIDDASAPAYLRMTIDTHSYEQIIGRKLNTRHADIFTSVHKALDAGEILSRAFNEDGQGPVERFRESGRYQCYITHETLPHSDLWFRAFPKLRIVLTVRHPIDVCYSWNSRGHGARLGTDPLAFTPVADIDGDPIPLYALENPAAYAEATPLDRVAMSVLSMLDKYDDALAALSDTQRDQMRVVCFEHFATDTMQELSELASWLDTTVPSDISIAMAREEVPRTIDPAIRRERRKMLSENLQPSLMAALLERAQAYETDWQLPSA